MEQPPLVSAAPLGAGPAIDPRFAEVIVEEGGPEDPGAAAATPALHAPSDVRREGVIAAARAPTAIDAEPNADAIDRHAVAVAVSRLTRERSAYAEVEIPEIGRIAVTAQRNAREIDVSVLAPAASVGILRDAQGELDASLRSAHVPLGSLHVGVGDHGARDGQRPSEGAPWQGEGSRASGDHAAIAGRSTASKRVRFVL